MNGYMRVALFAGAFAALLATAHAQSQPMSKQQPDMKSAFATADFSRLPALPQGRSTVVGGQIAKIDPVLDEFTLRIFGQKPMKILFDERTQLYRNGKRIPLRDLRPEEHASVQTALEGSKVFAMSIHVLSDMPQAEFEGIVLDFNVATRELRISSSISPDPIRLLLPGDTPVVRRGQEAFSSASAGQADLVNGALVTVTFGADEKERAVAKRVTVLAKPGSNFAFSGKLSSLDMGRGIMVLIDPRDQKRYQISFDPARFPITETLHVGDNVRVSAAYEGTQYSAADITQTQAALP
jgi:hypothetical protein